MKKSLIIILLTIAISNSLVCFADNKRQIEITNAGVAYIDINRKNVLENVYINEKYQLLAVQDGYYKVTNQNGKVGYISKSIAKVVSNGNSNKVSVKQETPSSTHEVTSPVSDFSPAALLAEAEAEFEAEYNGVSGTVASETDNIGVSETASEEDAYIAADDQYEGNPAVKPTGKDATFPCKHITFKNPKGKKTYDVADINDVSHVYRTNAVKANCFFIISKQEYRLYVYEKVGNEILLAATYPICYALKTGPKTRTGDSSTPECSYEKPFYISGIQDAHTWAHDFKDGRGSFLAYGHWFMRLDLSKSDCHAGCRNNRSIGIHGSSGNAYSVPGNDSEGCIRLRDADIKDLYTRFAQKGTKVVVKHYSQGRLDFEKEAIKKLGNKFQTAKAGYKYYITK